MMVGYKIPPTVGPQSFDKWVLSDLIECKNASTCEIGLSGRPGQAGSRDSQIRQNSAAPPQSVKSIKGTAANLVEAQLCRGFAKHSKNIGGSKLLEVCL